MSEPIWIQVRLAKVGHGTIYVLVPVYGATDDRAAIVQAAVIADKVTECDWSPETATKIGAPHESLAARGTRPEAP